MLTNSPDPTVEDTSISQNSPTQQVSGEAAQLPPPATDPEKAGKYINKLIDLINKERVKVFHTDLQKFDLTSMQDHYFINLDDYEVEVSHSKQPDSNRDFFVMIFNNIKNLREGCSEKVILAYSPLTEGQFRAFKRAAENAIERNRRRIEEARFIQAMMPIDNLLETLEKESPKNNNTEQKSNDYFQEKDEANSSDDANSRQNSSTQEDHYQSLNS